MGMLLAGSFFQILATIVTMTNICTQTSDLYKFLMVPYNMTMGLLSVVVAFTTAYAYAKSLSMKTMVNGITSMLMFLMVASPATTVTLNGGKATFTGLDTTSLGSVGLFTALIIAILSVRITYFFEKHNVVLRMPDVVPQFLQDSFSSLIPLLANIVIWHGINTIISRTCSVTLPMAISNILSTPLHALTSIPGILICCFITTFLWSFGIHGTMVVMTALIPSVLQAYGNNAALVAAGKSPVFVPVLLFMALASCGGTGNTFSLTIMGLRSKSEQIKAVSKASLIPGIFNINEPVTFGFPIMYNPILIIPFIVSPIIELLVLWGGYTIGFLKPAYVSIMVSLPIGVTEFLSSMSWHNIFIPVVTFIIGYIIFFPFFKVYEHQLVAKETAAKEAVIAESELSNENA
jgi:cellobiose PTS system EIIC component